ncbi:MAG: methyltransferase domain-containing protein [Candidatus Schekmanbacteria bacterium]|nr:methyltransferase domain-containing protein [Candidatus Schekmanbacteria bacterium]
MHDSEKIKRAVQQYYSQDAGQFYDKTRFAGLGGQVRHLRELNTIRQLTGDVAGQKILEVGCGTGRFSESLLQSKAQVTVLDFSPAMLDYTKRRLSHHPDFSLLRADAEYLPFKDNQFDGVLSVKLVSHFANPQKVLNEFQRVVNPGGWVIVDANNLFRLDFPLVFLKKYFNFSLHYFAQKNMYSSYLTPWQIEKLYQIHGLSRQALVGVGLLPKLPALIKRLGVDDFVGLDINLCKNKILRYVTPMCVMLYKKGE